MADGIVKHERKTGTNRGLGMEAAPGSGNRHNTQHSISSFSEESTHLESSSHRSSLKDPDEIMLRSSVLSLVWLLVVSCSASPPPEMSSNLRADFRVGQSQRKKLYVASPLGFSELGNVAYPKLLDLIKSAGYDVLDPWTLTPKEDIDRVAKMPPGIPRKEAWQKLNPVIGGNNAKAIGEADGVIAVLDGPDVDSGTAAEIGFAAGLGKPVLGYRGDFRLAADNEGSIVNLQVEYFVRQRGAIVTSLESLKTRLREVFGEPTKK